MSLAPRTLLVLPDAVRVEQALVEAARQRGFVDASGVCSFAQLIEWCEPARELGRTPVSPLVGRCIVARAARALPPGPFADFAHDASFARAAFELFAQLKSQRASVAQLREAAADVGAQTGLRAEYLASLWALVDERFVSLKLADREDLLAAAAARLTRELPGRLQGFSRVEVRLLADLAPSRVLVLRALEAACRARSIEFELWLPGTGATRADLMVTEVMAQFERGGEAVAPAWLDTPDAGRPLTAVLARLFEDDAVPQPAPPLSAFSAATPASEARALALRARQLMAEGAAPEQVAIVYRDLADDTEALLEALDEQGVPARARLGVPLVATAVGRLALGLPRLVDEHFPAGAVARYLESRHFSELSVTGVDAAATLAEAGVRDDVVGGDERQGAYAARLEAHARRAEGHARSQAQAGAIRHLALRADRLLRVGRGLRDGDTLEGLTRAWGDGLLALGFFEAPLEPDSATRDGGLMQLELDRAVARDQAALEALHGLRASLLEALEVSQLGEVPASRHQFDRWLHDAAADVNLVARGPRTGSVWLLDARELAGRRFAHVLVGGLVDGRFPGRPGHHALLSDDERSALNVAARARLFRTTVGESGERVPFRLAEDRLLFGLSLAAATDSVTLSHARLDGRGRELLPSPFLAELGRHVERFAVARAPRITVPEAAEVSTLAQWRERAMLDGASLPDEPWFPAARALADIELERLRFFSDETLPAGPHSGLASGVELGAQFHALSASALDTWGTCAFKGFAQRLLKLEPVEQQGEEIDPATLGSLLHQVLERFVDKGLADPTPSRRDGHLRDALAEGFAEHQRHRPTGHPLVWAQTRASVTRQLTELVADEAFAPFEGTVPSAVEVKFKVPLPGAEQVVLQGSMDRVDSGPGLLNVIDYKSAAKVSAPERGRRLFKREWQLPLYLWVQRQRLGPKVELDAAWVSIKKRQVVTLREALASQGLELDEVLEGLPATLNALLARLRAGDFGARSHDCTHCRFRPVCRVSNRTVHEGDE